MAKLNSHQANRKTNKFRRQFHKPISPRSAALKIISSSHNLSLLLTSNPPPSIPPFPLPPLPARTTSSLRPRNTLTTNHNKPHPTHLLPTINPRMRSASLQHKLPGPNCRLLPAIHDHNDLAAHDKPIVERQRAMHRRLSPRREISDTEDCARRCRTGNGVLCR